MPAKFNRRDLHAEAQAEVGDLVLARKFRGENFAFNAALAETAWHEDAAEAFQDFLRAELLDVLGVTWLEMPGFEGDDLIATMAARAEAEGRDFLVVTGDRDSYQLVHDPHVRVLYNKRGVSDYAIYDEAGILERTGVTPAQYADYAALRGDPSDNLVGANGVGEKTAAKLVNEYPTLEAILGAADKQTPKIRASLEEARERVLRNASIMVLRDDLELSVDPAECVPRPDWSATQRLLDFLEMKSMSKRLTDAFARWSAGVGETDTRSAPSSEELSVDYETFSAASVDTYVSRVTASSSVAVVPASDGSVVVAVGDIVVVFVAEYYN